MFGSLAKAILITTLGLGIAAGAIHSDDPAAASPTAASSIAGSLSDSSLVCGSAGSGTFHLAFPFYSAPHYSYFAYRVNGGAWQVTNWYFIEYGRFLVYDGRWINMGYASSGTFWTNSGSATIEAWEWRVDAATGAAGWQQLRPCSVDDFGNYGNGGIVTYNR